MREAADADAKLRRRHGGDEFSDDEDADPAPLLSPRTGPTAQRRLRVVKSHESGLDRLDARSEAGSVSILSERTQALVRQTATAAVENLLRPPLHCAAAGAVCMFGPPLIVAVSPLLLVLLPLTLPFGLMLTILGLVRAAFLLVISQVPQQLPRALEQMSPRRRLHHPRTAEPRADGGGSIAVAAAAAAAANPGARPNTPPPEPQLAKEGSLAEITNLTAHRGERLVRQLSGLLRSNVQRVTQDISGEVEQHLQALQQELQSWVGANANLKPYCTGRIGWMLKAGSKKEQVKELDFTTRFTTLMGSLPPAHELLKKEALGVLPLPPGRTFASYKYLLVPGLLTKWYPLYMAQLRADLKRLGLDVVYSRVDTDQAVRVHMLRRLEQSCAHGSLSLPLTPHHPLLPLQVNAARLRHEILELAQGSSTRPGEGEHQVILLGHSKGAVDAAAALSLFPELHSAVGALVSLQGPHGGSAIAHDLANTSLQKSLALGALERLLRGCRHAVLDLSFSARQEFYERHEYPRHAIPTLCVATCDQRPCSLLRPTIEYIALRYGEWSDGCVCQADAILAACPYVLVDDMDHFGPAWPSFPATDQYDPTRLWLVSTSLALTAKQAATERGD